MKVALRAHWCWKTTSVAHRRATDGMLPRAARMGRLVRVVGGRVAWPVAVEVGAALDGAAVCRRSARRGVLDSHGRAVRRRSALLLLSAARRGARAGMCDDYQAFYFFLRSVGQRWQELGRRVLVLVLRRAFKDQQRVLVAIDDSPTKRYGPKVQGAGIHHDPPPGPTGRPFCYGHVWVTLAVIVRHPLWGTIGLPIWSWLYVRRQDVAKLPKRYHWTFQTKLEQAADLVLMAAETLQYAGKQMWVVVDGWYAKRPFVRAVIALG